MKKDEAFEWFVRGFKKSSEGGNFEWPFHNTDDSDFREQMRSHFEEEWKEEEN